MFCTRAINIKINMLHEKCLHLIYNEKTSSFDELLKFYKSVTIHQRNIQKLALEMFKVLNSSSPEIMKEVFPLNTYNNYDLRYPRQFLARPVKPVYHGTDSPESFPLLLLFSLLETSSYIFILMRFLIRITFLSFIRK